MISSFTASCFNDLRFLFIGQKFLKQVRNAALYCDCSHNSGDDRTDNLKYFLDGVPIKFHNS